MAGPSDFRVVVIGAGVGGLAAAIDLARAGADVTVLERAASPGGKLRALTVDGAAIDSGPTVLTMKWVFDSLFDEAGLSLADHLTLTPLDILARHAWSGGARLDLFADPARSADAIGTFAGASEARGFEKFSARARDVYATLKDSFISAARPNPVELARRVGLARLGDLWRISPFETLWSALGDHFRDPRLRQLFGRYATYCGSSPFDAPATLMLVTHVEQEGVWSVEGGMARLADTLAKAATTCGARMRYEAQVKRIETHGGRASGVTLANGEAIAADAIIFNGDADALATGLLGRDAAHATAATPARARSLSAITLSMRARTEGFPLTRHNVFFSDDYPEEFEDIFQNGFTPRRPTVYLCAQDRGDDDSTLHERERMLLLVNAPADGDETAGVDAERVAMRIWDRLAQCGLSIERDAPRIVTTPQDFANLFPGAGGALYGRASHGWMASFQRAGARSRLPGLYLAGGSVHPGPGLPMAALSGRLAAAAVLDDRPRRAR